MSQCRAQLGVRLLTLALACVLAACDFVDAGGRQGNKPPRVQVTDIIVTEGEVGTLDGSATTDDFGALRSVSWALEESTIPGLTLQITEISTNPPLASFVAPMVSDREVLVFSVTVVDRDGSTVTENISATINNTPRADAGGDRIATEDTTATLNAAASIDSDGTIDSFVWVQEAGLPVTLVVDSADPRIARFVVPTVGVGANRLPSVDAGPDQQINLPGVATLDGTVTDDGLPGPALTTSWNQISGPSAATISDTGAVDTMASFPVEGTYVLRVTADDGQLSAFDDITITVDPPAPNQLLQSTATTIQAGTSGFAPRRASGSKTVMPLETTREVLRFRLQVIDNDGASSEDAVNITINDAPTANGVADSSTLEDTEVTIDVLSNDEDLDGSIDVGTVVIQSAPANGSVLVMNTGQVVYTPAENFEGPLDSFAYTVNDNDGATSNVASVSVTITPVNDPPVAVDDAFTVAEDTLSNIFDVLANDTDVDTGDTQTIIAVGAPGNGGSVGVVGSGPGNALQYTPALNFVGTESFSYTVSDGAGVTDQANVTVVVTNVNDPPTIILLDNATVIENAPPGTIVGTLSSVDPDIGDTHSYTLVPGAGSSGNASFTIVGSQLQAAIPLDFESQPSWDIRVRSTDVGGLSRDQVFTVVVANVNEPPVALALSPTNVAENEPIGTFVGSFTTDDPDVGDTHAYQLVPGLGDSDNSAFSILGNQLLTARVFDVDVDPQSSFSIRVRSTDGGALPFEQVFTVTVTAANEAPTQILLSNNSVAENRPPGTVVGNFSSIDPDAGDTHTYTLVNGTAGSAGNGSFSINGTQLRTAASFDFETQSSFSIRVRSTDSSGLSRDEVFTVVVANVNERPTAVALSSSSVPENEPVGTFVGSFTTDDPDAGDTHTYALVGGLGSTGNNSFSINTAQLRTAASFDFETQSSFSIRVRSTDSGGLAFDQVFTVTVTNVNEAPTQISLSNNSVAENQPPGTVVGNFSSIDPDAGNAHTYTLVGGSGSTGNGSFSIAGTQLRTAATFDFEAQNSFSIRVRSTDNGVPSAFLERVFTITVTDVVEAAAAGSFGGGLLTFDTAPEALDGCWTVAQQQALNGFLRASDVESPDQLEFSVQSNGQKGTATIVDARTGQFVYLPTDNTVRGVDRFVFRVTDAAGGTATATATVVIAPRLMPLGDSVTAGLTDAAAALPVTEERTGYREPLLRLLRDAGHDFDFVGGVRAGEAVAGFDPDHEGHIGWSAGELARGSEARDPSYPDSGIYAWLTQTEADFVLLHAGTDVRTGSIDDHVAILDEIDRFERDSGNDIVVFVAQIIDENPADPSVTAFNAELATALTARIADPGNPAYPDRLVVVDQHAALLGADGKPDPARYADALYPNASGYAAMATTWADAVMGLCEAPVAPPN